MVKRNRVGYLTPWVCHCLRRFDIRHDSGYNLRMKFKVAVVEIAGRQYLIEPNSKIQVNFLGDIKEFVADKVLLLASDNGVEVGAPYLKDKIDFNVVGSVKGDKKRVSTYHAKANTRRTVGSRDQ